MKELLHRIALDENEKIIHISGAKKGIKYFCPECKGSFVYRNSGSTKKGAKRPHFSHLSKTFNCTGEGILHLTFKKSLHELLLQYQSENRELNINWDCTECHFPNSKLLPNTNLLRIVEQIELEFNLGVCRPDLALLDKNNKPIAAIEIVDSHAPEEHVLEYYKQNRITLIQINLESDEDILRVEEKITNPDLLNLCINNNCVIAIDNPNRELINAEKICFAKKHKLITKKLTVQSVFGKFEIPYLTKKEVLKLKNEGFNIKAVFDKTTKLYASIIVCPKCVAFNNTIKNGRYSSRRGPRF